MTSRILYLAIACLFSIPALASDAATDNAQVVSMFDLIANKDRYDGKLIQVAGFFSLTWEDDALYYSKSDYAHLFTENAVWIDMDEKAEVASKKYDQKYGYVIGVYSAKKCGHLCLYGGSIKFVRFGVMYNEIAR